MKHRHGNRILGRVAADRHQLLQNLTSALLTYGRIVTTAAKAKELRRVFEPLLTEARQELTLHRRRKLLQSLIQASDLDRLLAAAKATKNRAGGYLRLTRLPVMRHDSAAMMHVELVDKP